MKKLILSLSIIGAITIGTGAIASATEENSPKINTTGGAVISESENSDINEDYNISDDKNYSSWRNQNCHYYGEGYQGREQRNEEGNGYGFNSGNRGRGSWGRSGSMMRF
ncbi:hypothetical protein [Clostridium sp.]|uniref:hypothetical protein n=1 Tax=Clostridium sp. TaxID=1506 RepID=UPI0025BEE405|nr:hypothetical protein [Clostridium sp.]